MKKIILLSIISVFLSCRKEKVDPQVSTFRLTEDYDQKEEEIQAAVRLYKFYDTSDKSNEYYEVITKRMMILNYYPAKQLLTVYDNQDSGWSGQYKDVGIAKLDRLGKDKITFEKYDSLLVRNDPMISVKTNGNLF